ncbi:MAG: 3-deoxy-manno-octulosonate cytidylyltransferase [Myxococcota bacterium]
MTAVGIIPARFGSTRFPGKVLTPIAGRPMIQHVWEGARTAKSLRTVLIATDDERVAETCRGFGAEVALTSADHPTGTDRLAEVSAGLDDPIVVNVQGDEPSIEGFVIDATVAALQAAPSVPMATVVHRAEADALTDPNRVKVVIDQAGSALYFSRAPIPHTRSGVAPTIWQHVGLYAYRREFLAEYVLLPATPLEQAEALEQLRALEHGYRIQTAVIENWVSRPVDVPADVAEVEAALAARAGARR